MTCDNPHCPHLQSGQLIMHWNKLFDNYRCDYVARCTCHPDWASAVGNPGYVGASFDNFHGTDYGYDRAVQLGIEDGYYSYLIDN